MQKLNINYARLHTIYICAIIIKFFISIIFIYSTRLFYANLCFVYDNDKYTSKLICDDATRAAAFNNVHCAVAKKTISKPKSTQKNK